MRIPVLLCCASTHAACLLWTRRRMTGVSISARSSMAAFHSASGILTKLGESTVTDVASRAPGSGITRASFVLARGSAVRDAERSPKFLCLSIDDLAEERQLERYVGVTGVVLLVEDVDRAAELS